MKEAKRRIVIVLIAASVVTAGTVYYIKIERRVAAENALFEQQESWKMKLVDDIHKATTDMWACASETWQIENGPICKKACSEYVELYNRELHPPQYIGPFAASKELDVSGDSLCKDINKPSRKRFQ
jgi:hypothetical protein